MNPDQWRLFIDLSKVSLKVVLLHNGNRFPSVPLAHAANMKESYESMKVLLDELIIKNLNGTNLVISRLWECYFEYNSDTQNTAVPVRVGQPGQEELLCK